MKPHDTYDKLASRASDLGSKAGDIGSRASGLGVRAQGIATESVLPVLQSAASTATDTVLPAVADRVVPVYQNTVLPVLQDSVLPRVASASSAVVEATRDYSAELWERLSETEQAQELARRAALVASGVKGESPRRWPLLVLGIMTGVAIGTLVGRKDGPDTPAGSDRPDGPSR